MHTDEGLVGISVSFRHHLQGTNAIIKEVLRPAIIGAGLLNIEPVSIRDDWPILKESLKIQKSRITLPEGPALGIELDENITNTLARR